MIYCAHQSSINSSEICIQLYYKIPPLMSLPFHLEITDPRTNFWVSLAHTQHTRRVRLRHSPKSFPFPQRKKTKSIVMNPVGTLLWFQNKQTQQLRPTSVLQHHRPLQQRLRLIAGLLHHL